MVRREVERWIAVGGKKSVGCPEIELVFDLVFWRTAARPVDGRSAQLDYFHYRLYSLLFKFMSYQMPNY